MSLGRRVMTGAYINGHVDEGNKGDEVLARYDVNMRKDMEVDFAGEKMKWQR